MSAIDDVLRRKAAIDAGCYYEGEPTEEDLRTAIEHVSGYGDEFSWPFDAQALRGSERDYMVETAALLLCAVELMDHNKSIEADRIANEDVAVSKWRLNPYRQS